MTEFEKKIKMLSSGENLATIQKNEKFVRWQVPGIFLGNTFPEYAVISRRFIIIPFITKDNLEDNVQNKKFKTDFQ